jgi:hypothetical protein
VIVTSAEQSRLDGQFRPDRGRCGESELGQIEHRLLLIGTCKAHKMIEDFGDAKRGESRIRLVFHELLDLGRSWFVLEQSDDGIGVEDDHLRRSRVTSSLLDWRRMRSLFGPRVRYLPRSAPTGSAGSGRRTTRSPRSTTTTWSAFHRARASAGIDTCPLDDTFIT